MNIGSKKKIVILGMISKMPVAGVVWQYMHYLVGFQRLGYDVYYVESHAHAPTMLMESKDDDGTGIAVAHLSAIMKRFDLQDRWAFHAIHDDCQCYGMTELQLKELYRTADLIINMHGGTLPLPEHYATGRLVYLETDPVQLQIELYDNLQSTIKFLEPHCAFFTFGENYGQPDCGLPVSNRFHFLPTRQPVICDYWEHSDGPTNPAFTTIGNWNQSDRMVTFRGEPYYWSKHFEFLKFIDLPSKTSQPFELALGKYGEADKQLLEQKGWRVRHAWDLSVEIDSYRQYIQESRGEFTVAKDQNVRLRSGWFSDRSATYLAAGRPVITQDTGFGNIFPTGRGLFEFSTIAEIEAALEQINQSYDLHSAAASALARDYFGYDVVLSKLLDELGMQPRSNRNVSNHEVERFSANAPNWYQGSALEPTASQALPADSPNTPIPSTIQDEAEPEGQCVPRPSQGTRTTTGNDPREVSDFAFPPSLLLRLNSKNPPVLTNDSVQTILCGSLGHIATGCIRLAGAMLQTAAEKRASIIVLTHNNVVFTKLCLESLLFNTDYANYEVIVVDNASTDETTHYLQSLAAQHHNLRLILNERNVGFAIGNNQAIAVADGDVLVLLNNDTIPPPGWLSGLMRRSSDEAIGIVGPVTNRTGNEAQIQTDYQTYGEMLTFSEDYCEAHRGEMQDIRMLAMYCVAIRRDVCERVGPLDEQFAVGMFEDDDFCMRVREAGYRVVCAEDVFVHHFGGASFGNVLATDYSFGEIFHANRRRWEQKWGQEWKPYNRRSSVWYDLLVEEISTIIETVVPAESTVAVASKGDERLCQFQGRKGIHFPQVDGGVYAGQHPANSDEAIADLENLRTQGATAFVIPSTMLWWQEYYPEFFCYLESKYIVTYDDEKMCRVYALNVTNPI